MLSYCRCVRFGKFGKETEDVPMIVTAIQKTLDITAPIIPAIKNIQLKNNKKKRWEKEWS